MKTIALLAVLLVCACVSWPAAGTGGKDPLSGHFFYVTNVDSVNARDVVAEATWREGAKGNPRAGDLTRLVMVHRDLSPGERIGFRWPFAYAQTGRLGLVLQALDDTLWSQPFNPIFYGNDVR